MSSSLRDESSSIYRGRTLEQLKVIKDNTVSYEFEIQFVYHDIGVLCEDIDQKCNFCKSRYALNQSIPGNIYESKFTPEGLRNIKTHTKDYAVCVCENRDIVLRSKLIT